MNLSVEQVYQVLNRLRRNAADLIGRFRKQQPAGEPGRKVLSLDVARRFLRGDYPAHWPPALCQAFSVDPLEPGDPCFVGREQALAQTQGAIEQWRSGLPVMVALSGPQGCGITSFISRIQAMLQDHEQAVRQMIPQRLQRPEDVIALFSDWFQLGDTPGSVPALIGQLRAAAPRVVLVDDGHFLVNRMAGLATARVFGSVMVATQQRHLWVLGCRRHSFARLQYLHQVERFFSHSVQLPYFTYEELTTIVKLRFQSAGTDMAGAAEVGAADGHPCLDAVLLRELHQCSRGKPDVAFLLLSDACHTDTENGRLTLDELPTIDGSKLQELDRMEMLTLAELIVHGNLSIDEHRAIFRIEYEESTLTLERLYNLGLVDRLAAAQPAEEADHRYQVVGSVWELVVRHLETANYLY